MKKPMQFFALAAIPLMAAGSDAATPAQQNYLVQLTLKRGDTLIGAPKMLVLPEQQARVAATNANGESYDLKLSVSALKDATYLVNLALDGQSAAGGVYRMTPAAFVKPGKTMAITIGTDAGQSPPLNLQLTVTPMKSAENK